MHRIINKIQNLNPTIWSILICFFILAYCLFANFEMVVIIFISNIFTSLFVILPVFGLAAIINNKYYFNSKRTRYIGPESLNDHFSMFMGLFYGPAFLIVLLIRILPSSWFIDFIPLLIPIFISLLPGFYLASRKNFLFFVNKANQNSFSAFLLRLFILIPGSSIFVLAFLFVSYFFLVFSFHSSVFMISEIINDWTPPSISFFDGFSTISVGLIIILSMIGGFLFILLFKKSIMKDDINDIPFEFRPDFMDHELYVFIPYARVKGGDLDYPVIKNRNKELIIGKQTGNLVLNSKELKTINYTTTGEFVVSEEALEIFQKYDLTGYQT